MCREAGVQIVENECTIHRGLKIPLNDVFCELLRIPILPHCLTGTGSSTQRTPTAVDLESLSSPAIPAKKLKKAPTALPAITEIAIVPTTTQLPLHIFTADKGKSIATSTSRPEPRQPVKVRMPKPVEVPSLEFPEFESEEMKKLGKFLNNMQAEYLANFMQTRAEVAALATRLDMVSRDTEDNINDVLDIAKTGLLTVRGMARELNTREQFPIYLTAIEEDAREKEKGKKSQSRRSEGGS